MFHLSTVIDIQQLIWTSLYNVYVVMLFFIYN